MSSPVPSTLAPMNIMGLRQPPSVSSPMNPSTDGETSGRQDSAIAGPSTSTIAERVESTAPSTIAEREESTVPPVMEREESTVPPVMVPAPSSQHLWTPNPNPNPPPYNPNPRPYRNNRGVRYPQNHRFGPPNQAPPPPPIPLSLANLNVPFPTTTYMLPPWSLQDWSGVHLAPSFVPPPPPPQPQFNPRAFMESNLPEYRFDPLIHGPPPPELLGGLRWQIEYYFSERNLRGDFYLKSNMDAFGWVHLSFIAEFNRIKRKTLDLETIRIAMISSLTVELDGFRVRKRGDWAEWIAPGNHGGM